LNEHTQQQQAGNICNNNCSTSQFFKPLKLMFHFCIIYSFSAVGGFDSVSTNVAILCFQ